jgi:hypothetical protein
LSLPPQQDVELVMTGSPGRSVERDHSIRQGSTGVVHQVQYEIGPAGLDRRVLTKARRRPDVLGPSDRIDESGATRLGDLDRF